MKTATQIACKLVICSLFMNSCLADEHCSIRYGHQPAVTEICTGNKPHCCGALDSRHCCSFETQLVYYSLMMGILGLVSACIIAAVAVCRRVIKEPATDIEEHQVQKSISLKPNDREYLHIK